MNTNKASNNQFVRQTVVPIRAGFDDAAVLPSCLSFFRTRQIAIDVAGARESELAHIRGCKHCHARLRAFQRQLGTVPEEVVHREVAEAVQHVEEPYKGVVTMFAVNLFNSTKAQEDSEDDASHRWRHTHDLVHTLRYARAHQNHASALFTACGSALARAGTTHALHARRLDDAHAFVETLEEGFAATHSSPSLLHGYSRLLAKVAIDGPPVIRHAVLGTLWNLFDHGHEARHAASAALGRIVASRHAPEVTPAAALIWQLHARDKPQHHCESPELQAQLRRIGHTRARIVHMLSHEHSSGVLIDRFERLLSHAFEHRSARAQIVALLVARTALHGALRDAAALGISGEIVQECLSKLFFRHHDERSRPLLIDTELAAAAVDSFPGAYAHALLDAVRPDPASALRSHDRHVLIASAVKAHNRLVLAGAAPARFHHDGDRWTFTARGRHGIHHFFHELAAIANEHLSHAFHLEWANARFEAVRPKRGKVHRSRARRGRATKARA